MTTAKKSIDTAVPSTDFAGLQATGHLQRLAAKKIDGDAMANDEKIKGQASYFPSIEKTYGKPVAHWLRSLTHSRTTSM